NGISSFHADHILSGAQLSKTVTLADELILCRQ
ncbi:MAG: hypothetical protein ACI8Z9_001457, partial [Paraglaciecola sp.]